MTSESHLAQAERHVREGEARVAHLTAIIDELERDGHRETAARAREVLITIQQSLALARDYLRMEQAAHGAKP